MVRIYGGEGGVQKYPYAGSVCTELAMCRSCVAVDGVSRCKL